MYKTKMTIVVASVAMLLVASAPAWAAFGLDGTRDSSNFVNTLTTGAGGPAGGHWSFEGDVVGGVPQDNEGVNLNVAGYDPGTYSSAGGIMNYVKVGAPDPNLSDTWTDNLDEVNGYTYEISIKVTNSEAPGNLVNVIHDGVNQAYMYFDFLGVDNTFRVYLGDGGVVASHSQNFTNDFVNVRLVNLGEDGGGLSRFNVYLNTEMVFENVGPYIETSATGFSLGGDVTDITYFVDYIRFDSTGSYAPVPEPATLLLLSLGGLLAGLRRKA